MGKCIVYPYLISHPYDQNGQPEISGFHIFELREEETNADRIINTQLSCKKKRSECPYSTPDLCYTFEVLLPIKLASRLGVDGP